ncbi:hypothetical protein SAMN05444007_103415 [Cribrihabitans marinus]|uniref:Uncharacterized protein n=1 Tax=Cribrihabitans marinus TaxID=1227549 RepID=A0A1H6WGD0_9RHOB|nr:hypothetical protein [Cribrihabitans marinus]SEJ14264.1 hypothetical protein SAMN05444007_103415 [Cribrihabitans marinus]
MNKSFVKSVILAAATIVALGVLAGTATTGTDSGSTRPLEAD